MNVKENLLKSNTNDIVKIQALYQKFNLKTFSVLHVHSENPFHIYYIMYVVYIEKYLRTACIT